MRKSEEKNRAGKKKASRRGRRSSAVALPKEASEQNAWRRTPDRGKKELLASEQRFRLVFENVTSGILMTGSEGRVLMANSPALQLLGLSSKAIGQNLRELLPPARPLLARTRLGTTHRLEMRTSEGEKRLLSWVNVAVDMPEGPGLITLFHDIGRLHQAEERRRRAEQLAYVGELAARLSHEIKNPLATIQMGLKVVSRNETLNPENQEIVSTLIREVENTAQMVSGLLSAARHEKWLPEITDLGAFLQDAGAIFASLFRPKGKNYRLISAPGPLPVIIAKKAMSRALGNLVYNALEAVGPGGSVEVECGEVSGEEVRERFPSYKGRVAFLRVKDDGPGIPSEIQGRIFEPFFTTKESGTGLGMAVVQDVVISHGGVIGLASEPGRGTTFRVFLPLGERPPCWEWFVYREWEIYYGEDHCRECEIRRSESGHLCWRRKMLETPAEGERFVERCITCPVYLAGNLGHYYRSDE